MVSSSKKILPTLQKFTDTTSLENALAEYELKAEFGALLADEESEGHDIEAIKSGEPTGESRKLIKKLRWLFIEYVLDVQKYEELQTLVTKLSVTEDTDLKRELAIVSEVLHGDIDYIMRNM